jgi:CBS domain-containing protein
MRIEQLMTKLAKTCTPGISLSEAAQMMWNEDCGCLPVTADDGSQRLLGMITDRDICTAIRLEEGARREFRVEDAMTEVVRACNPGDPISEAVAIMGEARVRRLPVVDALERVIGLLSLADLALEAERQAGRRDPEITLAEVGGLLAKICQPHESERGSERPLAQNDTFGRLR